MKLASLCPKLTLSPSGYRLASHKQALWCLHSMCRPCKLLPCSLEIPMKSTQYFQDLYNLNQGIAGAMAPGRVPFVFDNVNLPAVRILGVVKSIWDPR